MAHFTGSSFTQVELPESSWEVASLRAAASGVWLTTADDFYRRTGDTWTHIATKPDVYEHRSYIRADDDIWVIGAASMLETDLLARHWDGQSWHSVPMEQRRRATTITDVLALSPTDAWAIGYSWSTTPDTPVMTHWDGTAWTNVALPAGFNELTKIVQGADGTLWALGHLIDEPAKPGLLRYSGGTWEKVPTTAVPNRSNVYASALAVVPGTGALWTLGSVNIGGPVVLTDG